MGTITLYQEDYTIQAWENMCMETGVMENPSNVKSIYITFEMNNVSIRK